MTIMIATQDWLATTAVWRGRDKPAAHFGAGKRWAGNGPIGYSACSTSR